MAVAAAGDRTAPLAQDIPLPWEARVLSPAEQVEIQAGKIVLEEIPVRGKKGRTFEAVGIVHGDLGRGPRGSSPTSAVTTNSCPGSSGPSSRTKAKRVFLVEQHLKLPLGVHRRYRLRYTGPAGDGGLPDRLGQGALAGSPAQPFGRRHLGPLAGRALR
ncbi:MAG: hypothetical protein MZV63_14335 [Marinilabiliales bacterium]|nr:hypothetical protein [Marinilabiliales bacterium]